MNDRRAFCIVSCFGERYPEREKSGGSSSEFLLVGLVNGPNRDFCRDFAHGMQDVKRVIESDFD